MRILLAQNSRYYPAHGGGDKSNRLLLEGLAARGHICQVVARISNLGPREHAQYLDELGVRKLAPDTSAPGAVSFRLNGVDVHVVTNTNLRAYGAARIAAFDPDIIITSTDDPAQILLEAALHGPRARVVYLARATLALPFGPDCAFHSAPRTAAIAQADLVVGVSQYVAGYIRKHAGVDAVHVPISLMEAGPWPALGRFENEFVALVNPCAVKGIAIFLGLAARMPDVPFAAIPTWGTNQADRAALDALPNVTVLDPVDDIDRLFARTRVLLVPSLWAEARSRIIVEAMLRGVPVLAADVGGIPEAMMGVPCLLPVRPIAHYQPRTDEQMVPLAEVPEQDLGPWQEALARLLSDRAHYDEISRASRQAALAYAGALGVEPFERLLEETLARPRRAPGELPAAPASALDKLSPEKRRLLELRLRHKACPWFAGTEKAAALRLFCFPHAGGGAASFAGWSEGLPPQVAVCPVRLPGREGRAAEPPLRDMAPLVQEITAVLRPFTSQPFAFFGHSMGAVVAFEVARELRRRGLPLPRALYVSGARAPQFRLGHVPPPEPGDDELLDHVARLHGLPRGALENPDIVRTLLPALRADAILYSNYCYQPEPPLDCPLRAYGGSEDPHISARHLERWREQTTASFSLRLFPGSHFYLQTGRPAFLAALGQDLSPVNWGQAT